MDIPDIPDIKEIRLRTGLSQRKFAEMYGLPFRTLQEWEQKRRVPPEYVIRFMYLLIKEEQNREESGE